MKKTAIVAAGVLSVMLTACGSSDGQGTPTSPVPATTLANESPTSAGFTVAAPIWLEGENYRVYLPRVEGGKADARAEFNESMRTAANEWIAQSEPGKVGLGGDGVMVTGLAPDSGLILASEVRIGERVLGGVLGIEVNSGGAHPNSFVSTIVTNVDTAQPITIPDLFTDLQQGLTALHDQAAILVPQTRAGNSYAKEGIAPDVQNFANWLPTPEGMRIYLGEIASHAQGNIIITVPWSALDSVLKPGMRAVVSS